MDGHCVAVSETLQSLETERLAALLMTALPCGA
jgi:hypothetical protein